jgi:Domain of unknown function (DUF4258)
MDTTRVAHPERLRITRHVEERMAERRITRAMIFDALREPEMTYPNPVKGHGDQTRFVKGPIVVVVDWARRSIPTVLYNKANDGWRANADLRYA